MLGMMMLAIMLVLGNAVMAQKPKARDLFY